MKNYIKSNAFVNGVRIANKSGVTLTTSALGLDIRAYQEDVILIEPGERKLISTGLYIDIPVGYDIYVKTAEELVFKYGIVVLDFPRYEDGEVRVLLSNTSENAFTVKPGDKIAQLTFYKVYEPLQWVEVDDIKNNRNDKDKRLTITSLEDGEVLLKTVGDIDGLKRLVKTYKAVYEDTEISVEFTEE